MAERLKEKVTLYEMLDYLCSRIDFSKAALNAQAIRCMNTLFIELRKQKEEFDS